MIVKRVASKLPETLVTWIRENFEQEEQHVLTSELRLLYNRNSWPKQTSLADYFRKGLLIVENGKDLNDYASVPRSFHAMKAGVRWYLRLEFHNDYFSNLSNPLAEHGVLDSVFATRPAFEREFLGACRVHCANIENLRKQLREFHVDNKPSYRKTVSKIHSLRVLPDWWLDTFWCAVQYASCTRAHLATARFQEIVATMSLIGARPFEFRRDKDRSDEEIIARVAANKAAIRDGDGVLVEYRDGELIFTVAGAKLDGSDEDGKGQEWRRIFVTVKNDQSRFLRERILKNGGRPLLVGIDIYTKLTRWIRNLSKECFPGIGSRDHVATYTFRHLISGEMKAAHWDPQKIAMVLGQQASGTQQYYGRARLSKTVCSIRHVEAASEVRMRKQKKLSVVVAI